MKNKRLAVIAASVLVLLFFVLALNIKVYTRQGVDYNISFIKIPLYLKLFDFFNRHSNYRALVSRIVDKMDSKEQKALKIFAWTYNHIKSQPPGLPIIDDHVWHTIIRGYGAGEQSSDVFTTLCNYAGLNAFYSWAFTAEHTDKIVLSFVKIEGNWVIFDVRHGIYFQDKSGRLADINEIKGGDYSTKKIADTSEPGTDYKVFFANLPAMDDASLCRANRQSPVNRLIFELKKRINPK